MSKSQAEEDRSEASGHYANYQEYNKLLRTWFVAFGVGVPALLYSRPDLIERLGSLQQTIIVVALLLGSLVQVLVAYLNKYCSYYDWDFLVRRSRAPTLRRTRLEERQHWLSNQIWIDKWADRITGVAFLYSLFIVVWVALRVAEPTAFTPPPGG
ncbi:hypothetical protein [Reyranella soli]|uniref:DUF1230 domain-containing protein n=1 Tax=Reyranella soli TaxID=1230389 RepID=A0A512N6B4_9HYPH|nr:hypothetical protein [Reyranella soli]GEP54171.1 hypothetical protein RSO01_13370 [Reyranella soli]